MKKTEKRTTFIMHSDLLEPLMDLSNEDLGKILRAIYSYQNKGAHPSDLSGTLHMAFSFLKSRLNSDNEKFIQTCIARGKSGSMGGNQKRINQEMRRKNNDSVANGTKCYQMVANLANDSKSSKSSRDEMRRDEAIIPQTLINTGSNTQSIDKTNNNYNTTNILSLPTIEPVITREQVRKIFKENNLLKSNPDEFFDKYQAVGWQKPCGNNVVKIQDIAAAARSWDRNSFKQFNNYPSAVASVTQTKMSISEKNRKLIEESKGNNAKIINSN